MPADVNGGATDYQASFSLAASIVDGLRGFDDSHYALDPKLFDCVLHEYHSPIPWVLHRHHVILQSWTQALGLPDGRLIPACPTGHESLHLAISRSLAGLPRPHPVDEKVHPYLDEAVQFWHDHRHELRDVPELLGLWRRFLPRG